MKIITFLNLHAGVGQSSLIYHLCWMYALQGRQVVAVDLDPQARLSKLFLEEAQLESLWQAVGHPGTLLAGLAPLFAGGGEPSGPEPYAVTADGSPFALGISLLLGDPGLARLEDAWRAPRDLGNDPQEQTSRLVAALRGIFTKAAAVSAADLILVDTGPHLSATNRAALLATDHVIIPLAPDMFSMQGLRNLGPTLRSWRGEGVELARRRPDVPAVGAMRLAGYVCLQPFGRDRRPGQDFRRWRQQVPREYRGAVLGETAGEPVRLEEDPHCLGDLRHYHSLMPMAMQARRPMFMLKSADGAIGAHIYAVQECRKDFEALAFRIASVCGVRQPVATGATYI